MVGPVTLYLVPDPDEERETEERLQAVERDEYIRALCAALDSQPDEE